jgi:hypothetical protein
VVVGELGEETDPGRVGELAVPLEEVEEVDDVDDVELPPLGLLVLVDALLVESVPVELEVSPPCENVPRLVGWSRVSSRASLLKTRLALGLTSALAVPPPPPAADRHPIPVGASAGAVAALPLLVDEDAEALGSGAETFASDVAALFGLALVSRTALRRPSAAAASPTDRAKDRAGATTHSKVRMKAQVCLRMRMGDAPLSGCGSARRARTPARVAPPPSLRSHPWQAVEL